MIRCKECFGTGRDQAYYDVDFCKECKGTGVRSMELKEGFTIPILDHGYIEFIEHWGKDERVVEAARMSTGKGFLRWDAGECPVCYGEKKLYSGQFSQNEQVCYGCNGKGTVVGDMKLLKYLNDHKHHTPFEMAGCVIEVQAPIAVFREWHRHRTQCLAPDTMIHFDAPKSKPNRHSVYKLPISALWEKWQPSRRSSRPERQTNAYFKRSRVQQMQLRCLNEETGEIQYTSITDVIKGDPKPMVRVTAASGKQLTATREHRVFTSFGWMTLGEAIKGKVSLTLEGTTRGKSMRWEVPPVDEQKEKWEPVVGWIGFYEVSDYGRVKRVNCKPKTGTQGANGYDVVSLSRNGKTYVRTIHTLVAEAFLGSAKEGEEVRHKNHNRGDNRLFNLEYGSSKLNSSDMISSDRQQRLISVFEEIISVVEVGELPSYDLTVEGPYHNFIADGFVVHNSYNEMSARYTPIPDVNYMPTVDRCLMVNGKNRQAGAIVGANELTHESVLEWLEELSDTYKHCEETYQSGLQRGIPKELARMCMPVGRYSRMRAQAILRNWLAFLTLRMDETAQYEIRMYANAVGGILKVLFPRVWSLFIEGKPYETLDIEKFFVENCA